MLMCCTAIPKYNLGLLWKKLVNVELELTYIQILLSLHTSYISPVKIATM